MKFTDFGAEKESGKAAGGQGAADRQCRSAGKSGEKGKSRCQFLKKSRIEYSIGLHPVYID
jgi:hypothetical protein